MPIGPQFRRTTAMAANATAQPLQAAPSWSHRFPATNAIMSFTVLATTTDVEFEVTSGSEVLVQRGPVPGGGTAGVYPNFNDTAGQVGVLAGQEIAVTYFEKGGAPSVVMLEVHLEPV
jgi:hypothetical protein